jgi:hypothetical protein
MPKKIIKTARFVNFIFFMEVSRMFYLESSCADKGCLDSSGASPRASTNCASLMRERRRNLQMVARLGFLQREIFYENDHVH